jgi:two-component system, cell cycle sensor histidine kinase and response regulator CckA
MTLVFAYSFVITGCLALCLLFFLLTRKTYPGFPSWTAGVAVIAAGYLLFALREVVPLWVSVFGGNLALPIGLLFQLDGIKRFLGFSTSRVSYAIVPAALALALATFSFHWDSVYWRGVSTSLAVIAVQWYMAVLLYRARSSTPSLFIKVIASLLVVGGLVVLARVIWFSFPWNLSKVWTSESELVFFVAFMGLHLGESLSIIMLNAECMETELLKSKEDLAQTVTGLEEALIRQKKAEESLRDSEEKYRTFFETSRDAVFMTTVDGRFVEFNDVSLETLGYERVQREHLLGKAVSDIYANPEDREAHAAVLAKSGFSREYPVDLRKRDGTIIHTLITTVARKDPHGNIIGFQGTVRDITESKLAVDALARSRSELHAIYDSAPIMMCVLDGQRQVLYANRALAEFVGKSEGELKSGPACGVFGCINALDDPRGCGHGPKCESCPIRMALEDTSKTGVTHRGLEYGTTLVLDGSHREVVLQGSTARVKSDGQSSVLLCLEDITDRTRAEEGLRTKVTELNSFINNLPDMAWLKDVNSNFIAANKAFGDAVGMAPEYLASHTCEICFGPEAAKKFKEDDQEVMVTRERTVIEESIIDAKGNQVWLETIKSPILDATGNVLGTVGVARDITERRRAEKEQETLRAQLFQAQKLEAIGTLTGGIAHDFNNLLTIINGYTELVLSEKTSEDPCYADLQKVFETGRKGAELVQRLLALSKKAETNPQPLDVNRTVKNSVALMQRTLPKMIEIETVLGKDLSLVNADAAQVDQVIMNLCINAKEAMPEGGKLRIEVKNVIVDEADCKLQVNAKPGPHVVIEVTDTGAGMDAETLGRLFDPFFTTKGWDFRKGTGLSLPVAKGIVEQHRGWITCESEQGKGTTFRVYFPPIGQSVVAEEIMPAPSSVAGSARILLVDDEEYVRELGKRILERAGYRVITASNGNEALDIYGKDHLSIDLVVLDLIMPQMSGEKCLEELVRINRDVKVVVSTGHALDAREKLLFGGVAKGFVNKPYQMKQLLEVVTRALGG